MRDAAQGTTGAARPSDHTRVRRAPGEYAMTMLDPTPRRPILPNLRAHLDEAHAALRGARDELRDAAARHAGHDPGAALVLAQLAAGVDAVAAKVPPRWPQPVTVDMWLVEADRLHATLERARRGMWRLCDAADRGRSGGPGAPGVEPLRDALIGLTRAMSDVCSAALDLSAVLMPGVKAKARLAIRALAEEGDDPDDLAGLARRYAAERGPETLDALAWSAVADFLALESQR